MAGQFLNLSSIASDCGITHTTAKRWISVLEACFLILLLRPYYRFWRNSGGREVDILIELGSRLTAVEIKSAQTVAGDFFHGLNYWWTLPGKPDAPAALVYGGDRQFRRHDVVVYPWFVL